MTDEKEGLRDTLPTFLSSQVDFPDGPSYGLVRALTDYRMCHDGEPSEARIVFTARQINSSQTSDDFVIKIKVQVPSEKSPSPAEGPSTTTVAEVDILKKLRDAESPCTPHLVAFKKAVQSSDGPMPGGFITFLVMTKMPGTSLLNSQYWNKSLMERETIIEEFLRALKWLYAFGVEPLDCGLRNIMWEQETKNCTIIDFELWREANGPIQDRTKELQKWALARRPPPKDWWSEWNLQGR